VNALPAVEVSQTPEEKFREYLASRPRSQRFTTQQRDMVRYIFSKHNHFDADELIDEMKGADFRVSRPTVYRTLKKLVDAGLLRKINLGTRTVYEVCQRHQFQFAGHSFIIRGVCANCNRARMTKRRLDLV
jgi:Fur family transcriptional regulator, ferric uptake regulator